MNVLSGDPDSDAVSIALRPRIRSAAVSARFTIRRLALASFSPRLRSSLKSVRRDVAISTSVRGSKSGLKGCGILQD